VFGPTQAAGYWSTGSLPTTFSAWFVYFADGGVYWNYRTANYYARAVRSGR
jgi:hypothetical protein